MDYMLTDGFIDAGHAKTGQSFSSKRFKEMVLEHHTLSAAEQHQAYLKKITEYQGEYIQRDDITLLGFRL